METCIYDVLVIGSGAAGLGLSLSLPENTRIALISKESLVSGSSQHAQGGIACALKKTDSPKAHIADTLRAGDGLCDRQAVDFTVRNARRAIEWLIEKGVPFTQLNNDQEKTSYHLTQEGGHSERRILHVADKTGAVIIDILAQEVLNSPNIECFIDHIAIDLIVYENRCVGAYVFDAKQARLFTILANHIVLATGGASYIYQHTSNPNRTSGDGIAMAWRAGAKLANLEFTQFHPTCLFHPHASRYLITEVVRGEGGVLLLPSGERFMPHHDPRAELAPRDIVSRAIHHELIKNNIPCVYLDITKKETHFIKQTFPTIWQQCLAFGLDITKEPIPVVPAAHYTCGGVLTNLQGQTSLPHLYAVGETACTGLHGANRMASNSLLECLVFAASTAQTIQAPCHRKQPSFVPEPRSLATLPSVSPEVHIKNIQHWMWEAVGIVRKGDVLLEAQKKLHDLRQHIEHTFSSCALSLSFIELRNMADVAYLTTLAALSRRESRGTHYRVDFPNAHINPQQTLIEQLHLSFAADLPIPTISWPQPLRARNHRAFSHEGATIL